MLTLHHLLPCPLPRRNPTNTRPPRLHTQHTTQPPKPGLPPLPQQAPIGPPAGHAIVDDGQVDGAGGEGVVEEACALVVEAEHGPEAFGEALVGVSGGLRLFEGVVEGEQWFFDDVEQGRLF